MRQPAKPARAAATARYVWVKLRGRYIESGPRQVRTSGCRIIDDLRIVVKATFPALRRFAPRRLQVYLHDEAERRTPLDICAAIPASASESPDKALIVSIYIPKMAWVFLPAFPARLAARAVPTEGCSTFGDFRTPIMKAFARELGAFCESELRMRFSLEEGDDATENVLDDLDFPLTHLPSCAVQHPRKPICIRVVPVPGRYTRVGCAMLWTRVANRPRLPVSAVRKRRSIVRLPTHCVCSTHRFALELHLVMAGRARG